MTEKAGLNKGTTKILESDFHFEIFKEEEDQEENRKSNAFEAFMLIQKLMIGPLCLCFPYFYSRAGLIGGAFGIFVGFFLALYGTWTLQNIVVEIETNNFNAVVKTLDDAVYYSVRSPNPGDQESFLYKLHRMRNGFKIFMKIVLIVVLLSIVIGDLLYVANTFHQTIGINLYVSKAIGLSGFFQLIFILKNRENIKWVGYICFLQILVLFGTILYENIKNYDTPDKLTESSINKKTYNWFDFGNTMTQLIYSTFIFNTNITSFIVRYTSKNQVRLNFKKTLSYSTFIAFCILFILCLTIYLCRGNENMLPSITDLYQEKNSYLYWLIIAYCVSIDFYVVVPFFACLDVIQNIEVIDDWLIDYRTGKPSLRKQYLMRLIGFLPIGALVMMPINLTDLISYVAPIFSLPTLMLIPMIIKHFYFNYSKKVKIIDGVYVIIAQTLIIYGLVEAIQNSNGN